LVLLVLRHIARFGYDRFADLLYATAPLPPPILS
jgi:hypothetical protein